MDKRYESLKRELKCLKSALPPLPSPDELYDDIVSSCKNVMQNAEVFDKLRRDLSVFHDPLSSFHDLERDVTILELKAENVKTRFQFLLKHLRLLYSTVPLMIATKKTSSRAWQSRMETPQEYVTQKGKRKALRTDQSDIERILKDQLQGIEEFFTTLRQLRSECLTEERNQQRSLHQKILELLQSVDGSMTRWQDTLEQLATTRRPQSPITIPPAAEENLDERGEESERIAANAEYMEGVLEQEEAGQQNEEVDREIEALTTELNNVARRLRELSRKKTCPPRAYEAGIYRLEESTMRCVFCQAQGRHYSDSCDQLRTGEMRQEYLMRKTSMPQLLRARVRKRPVMSKIQNTLLPL
ncbi:hypothetical protein COOONC_18089 [Cooperia oncophora]